MSPQYIDNQTIYRYVKIYILHIDSEFSKRTSMSRLMRILKAK
ncbi:hypothetical protein GPLA_3890 [Paraglaciecola polaris LMG 21857]|uniref:Uncharacterized protein n=1 Tax=Paraglaciecola polaris LMG 21857 TaxID=1129793 RepID=K7AHQ9_9ALTE|nr:hypothetical protein GPLA_3890 [Paraglaciecola polaris LMG 21857]